jgi:hypothetical protein
MSGAIHPLPQYAFMAWCLVKAQGQLYLFTVYARSDITVPRTVTFATRFYVGGHAGGLFKPHHKYVTGTRRRFKELELNFITFYKN